MRPGGAGGPAIDPSGQRGHQKSRGAHPALRLDRLARSGAWWIYEGHGSPASWAPMGAPSRSQEAAVLFRRMRCMCPCDSCVMGRD